MSNGRGRLELPVPGEVTSDVGCPDSGDVDFGVGRDTVVKAAAVLAAVGLAVEVEENLSCFRAVVVVPPTLTGSCRL